MSKDDGSMTAAQRIERIEEEIDCVDRYAGEERAKIWKEIDVLKERLAKLQTAVALSNWKLAGVMALLFFLANVMKDMLFK